MYKTENKITSESQYKPKDKWLFKPSKILILEDLYTMVHFDKSDHVLEGFWILYPTINSDLNMFNFMFSPHVFSDEDVEVILMKPNTCSCDLIDIAGIFTLCLKCNNFDICPRRRLNC